MFQLYDNKMMPIRAAFAAQLSNLYTEAKGDILRLFLINHCAFGVGMTEKVASWIKRAGQKCVNLGYKELGEELIAHSKHEAGHEQYMITDTRTLVDDWNQTHDLKLSASKVLRRPYSPGVIAYQELHENCINSDAPYGQIAIEYEIEKVSVDFGPPLMRHCAQELGAAMLQKLSFISEHVALDVGHTAYNQKSLNNFLLKHPKTLDELIDTGTRALKTYGRYLLDCMAMAKETQASSISNR